VDLARRHISDDSGAQPALTEAEFAALQELLLAGGAAVTRQHLCDTALRRPWRAEDRSIDQLIFSLRHKLRDGEGGIRMIQSVRGAGYRLVTDQVAEV